MAYLLDTNVVSELRKRQRVHPAVEQWYSNVDVDEIHLSVLVIGEVRRGIEMIRRRDLPSARVYERWLKGLERNYEGRILPVTIEVCERWGALCPEQPLAPIDGLMAATALVHGLTLVTRNVADVERSGCDVLNPFVRA